MILSVLLFFTTSCDKDDPIEEPKIGDIQVGDGLPDFSVTLADGGVMNKKSLEGKISIVLLFTTNCKHCIALFPSIERLYTENKDNDNFAFVAIGRAQEEDVVNEFMKNKYTFPYSPQKTRDVYNLFAPSIVPRVYISNSDCIVEQIFLDDPLPTYDEMKNKIDILLEELCCKL